MMLEMEQTRETTKVKDLAQSEANNNELIVGNDE